MTFKAYDIVSHPVYGEGIVTHTVKPNESVVSIDFIVNKIAQAHKKVGNSNV